MQNLSYRRLAIFFFAWCLCWTGLQASALQYTFGFDWTVNLADAGVTNLLIAIAGYDMILVMKFYQPRQVIRLAMSIALAFLVVLAMHHFTLLIIDETDEYLLFLDKSMFIRGLYVWLMITLVATMSWLWVSLQESRKVDSRRSDLEKLAKEAELARLRQQLQPHFLFNSLNSISALAGTNPEEARKMIHQLSDFLRGTVKTDDQQPVTLAEELQHLELYLNIEKVRFGYRLKTEIAADDASVAMNLPSLLLQPLVENAIKFGLYDTTGEVTIAIRADTRDNYLVISITNPFDPATAQPRRGTGFGLTSVQRRLYLLYGRQDLLEATQSRDLFTTTLRIPQAS